MFEIMTVQELKENVLYFESKINTYTEEINKEIEKLKSEYIESECPYKVGDVYIRKSDGKKFTIYKVELEEDFYTYACPENAYIIYLDGGRGIHTRYEYTVDFQHYYAKEGEIESSEERIHKTSIQQSNDWLEKQNFDGFVNYAELWRLGYEQAMKELNNK